jgi:hypothetical protein
MKTPKNVATIKEAIAELEQQQKMQMEMLKQTATHTYENLNPANFLRNTLENAIPLTTIKKTIFNSAVGLATGYITQKLIIKNKDTFATKILGMLVNLLVAHAVAHNADTIKNWGEQLTAFITKAKKNVEGESKSDEENIILPESV